MRLNCSTLKSCKCFGAMRPGAKSTRSAAKKRWTISSAYPCYGTLTIIWCPRAWELRHNLTAYDAVYVALAEYLDAPLLTRDRRLANAPGHFARIDLI